MGFIMTSRTWVKILIIVIVLGSLGYCMHRVQNAVSFNTSDEMKIISKNSILKLDLHGVILNGKKFLKNLKRYSKDDNVKAILVDINSPGGAVGPSQELYLEMLKIKKETGKPMVCVATNLIASGAYYAAMACDKLVVTPGALVGSIGVIMEFANLEQLYSWAKISRYSIKSGKFKDTGAEYRSMSDEERQYFQEMVSEVYLQFRNTVKEGRKLDDETLNQYADGRVFTGAKAVDLKFADQVGTYDDAVDLAAEEARLGKDYEIFEPRKSRGSWIDFLRDDDDDELNTLSSISSLKVKNVLEGVVSAETIRKILRAEYLNQPMLLMTGYW